MTWSATLELRGAGGEPVDLARTLLSHGVASLPPNVVAAEGSSLETVLAAAGRAHVVTVEDGGPQRARVRAAGAMPPPHARGELLAQVRHMLRLDEDLSGFYAVAANDPAIAWCVSGAGRLMRSPTVFEDLVKTICTTNCTWAATERMTHAIVDGLGQPAAGAPERRAFPSPAAMAEADEAFYRDVARAGYRDAYLRALAAQVAEGQVDLEALADPELPDGEAAERLLALQGVGPYAAAHMMMLLGRYRPLVLDSWTRPTYRRIAGRPRVTDKGIERAFRRYGSFAGLAFWLTLTEHWLPSGTAATGPHDP